MNILNIQSMEIIQCTFGAGINGFGMGSGRITGQGKKGAKHYYLIGVDAGLFTTSFTINEVTEATFKQLR